MIRLAGLSDAGPPQLAPSANEVWYAGPYVIRISSEPGSRRLQYEAEIASRLSPAVRYPEIVAAGRATFGEWMVLRRLEGNVLSRAWPGLTETQRRRAVDDLADAVRDLHRVDSSGLQPPFLESDTLECPHQLPVTRVVTLLDRAAALPNVDPAVTDDARDLVLELAPAMAGGETGLIHGDLHFENVLWDPKQERVAALLDLEWARPGPPDLDLDVFLRFCADPELHVVDDYRHLASRRDYRDVPTWLKSAYPELFSHPRLLDRLTVYGISYDVRHLLLFPPRAPAPDLPPFHPYIRMRRWVEGRSHLSWMSW